MLTCLIHVVEAAPSHLTLPFIMFEDAFEASFALPFQARQSSQVEVLNPLSQNATYLVQGFKEFVGGVIFPLHREKRVIARPVAFHIQSIKDKKLLNGDNWIRFVSEDAYLKQERGLFQACYEREACLETCHGQVHYQNP